jgi:hypothetical protein
VQVPKRIQIIVDFVIEVTAAMVGFFAMYLAAIALNHFNREYVPDAIPEVPLIQRFASLN